MKRTDFPFARRAAAAQTRVLRGSWGLDYEGDQDAYRAACGTEVSPIVDAFARCPEIESIQVKVEPHIERAGGEFCLAFYVSSALHFRIGDLHASVDPLEGPLEGKAMEDLWKRAPANAERAQFEQAMGRINEEIRTYKEAYNIRHGERFWGKHPEFIVKREMVERAISVDPTDYAHALSAILGWNEPTTWSFDRPPHRWSPLTLSRVGKFLAAGVSPDACDDFGFTPLNAAVAYGRHPWMHALMRAGADLELADVTGMNPVSTAAAKGFVDLVEVLVRAGANPNGSRFAPSLVVASLRADARTMVPRMLALGADPSQQLPDGTLLSDNFSRVVDPTASRLLASAHTQRTIEGAFDGVDGAAPAVIRSGGMTL